MLAFILSLILIYTLYRQALLKKELKFLKLNQSVNPLKDIVRIHKEAVERQRQIERDRQINAAKFWSPTDDNSYRKDS